MKKCRGPAKSPQSLLRKVTVMYYVDVQFDCFDSGHSALENELPSSPFDSLQRVARTRMLLLSTMASLMRHSYRT